MPSDMAGFPTPTPAFTDLVWDASTKGANVTLAFANYKATSSAQHSVRGNLGKSTGRWYCEFFILSTAGSGMLLGVGNANALSTNYPGSNANSYGYFSVDGQKYNNAVNLAYGSVYATNDIVGMLLDCGTGELTFYVNGVSQGVAYSTLPLGTTWYPMWGPGGATAVQVLLMSNSIGYALPTNSKRWSNPTLT